MNSSTTTPSATPSPAPAAPQLITQEQLTQVLGISRHILNTWVRNKIVPMIKVSGFRRFDFAKVRAALEQHEQPAVGDTPEPSSSTGETTQPISR